MDSERFRRIEAIFNAAVDLDEPARTTYLDEVCGDDADLRHEVEQWLTADQASSGDTLLPHSSVPSAPDSMPGTRVGAYLVGDKIAEGGMGAVYFAERADEEFQQTVAIKFLATGFTTEMARQRFYAERQILAGLSHPNIGRLLDGGTLENGSPYLVMEYIAGLPIDHYCREHTLNTTQRLQIFQKVCAAVQYAHQNLVIHRDIKPSNILVTPEGEPKLLDFGIAKLTGPESNNPALTRADMRVLTPESASPEQIAGESITTATDVYSLGILLYRLLTGKSPYEVVSNKPQDIYRAILETDPERPSTAVLTPTDSNAPRTGIGRDDIAAVKLRRELRGDLDTIVLTTLRKEPERRYTTVRQLSEDIDNFLQQKPVMARRDSAAYRTTKFLRRHRWAVSAGIAVIAAAIAMVTFYTLQLADERNIAQQERDTAEQVADFIVDIFEVSDPFENRGNTISAREILDRGANKMATNLKDQPQIRVRMASILSEVYYGLGLYAEAETFAQQALASQRPSTIAAAQAHELLGNAQVYLTNYVEAKQEYETVLQIRTQQLGADHPLTLDAMANLGDLLARMGEVEASAAICAEAMAMVSSVEDVAIKSWVMACHAQGLHSQTQFDEAEQVLRASAALQRAAWGDDDLTYLDTLNSLAVLLTNRDREEEALAIYTEVLNTWEQALEPDHRNIGQAIINRGVALAELLQFDAALADADRILELAAQGIDDNGLMEAYAVALQADIFSGQGRYEKSVAAHLRALELATGAIEAPHPFLAGILNDLAGVYMALRRFDESREALVQSLQQHTAMYGADHPETIRSNSEIGNIALLQGDYPTALRYNEAAIASAAVGNDDKLLLDLQQVRCIALTRSGQLNEALELVLEIHPSVAQRYGATSPEAAIHWSTHAQIEHGLEEFEQSLKHRLISIEMFVDTLGEEHPLTYRGHVELAKTYHVIGNLQKAREHGTHGLTGLEKALPPDHSTLVDSRRFVTSLSE